MRRKKIGYVSSKKNFSRTARRVHRKNLYRHVNRGGIRF